LKNKIIIPINIPISPTLFVKKALLAANGGFSFSNQKPINKNELNPTNSQKTYIIIRESDRTIPFIEKVNIPRNAKYLEYLKSPFIYSVEYRWTKNDIKETTNNMMTVILSTKYPRDTLKAPVLNHSKELFRDTLWLYIESNKYTIALTNVKPISGNATKCDLFFILSPLMIKTKNDKIGKNKKEHTLISIKSINPLTP